MKRKIIAAIMTGCFVCVAVQPALAVDRAAKIVEIAESQLGYTGNGKHTKYNRWFYSADQAAPWCAIFISWCANEAGILNTVIGKNALASGFDTYNMEDNPFGLRAESFDNRAARMGDIVFVDNNGDGISNHVGLVTGADESYVYTVEGNVADKVVSLRYSRSSGSSDYGSARILFYAVPDYARAEDLTRISASAYTEIRNNSAEERKAAVITAGYENGRMTGVKVENVTFAAGETRAFARGENEKIFVWGGGDGIEPLA